MKKLLFVLCSIILIVSCENKTTYYEQFVQDKSISSRIKDLNKSIEQIREIEKGKLINEGLDRLKYEYSIGKTDRYIITYYFDEKGCLEIRLDTYFENETDTKILIEGFKQEMSTIEFKVPEENNQLYRWKNLDKSIWVELDYKDTSRGILVLTIQANE